MKNHTHFGIYGLLIEDNKILLIKKVKGPYKGKLDLPGGTPLFNERPVETLKREIEEETGLIIIKEELFDLDSVTVNWQTENEIIKVHHTGAFYKINKYTGKIKENIEITEINDDSKGAKFYEISQLNKNNLSEITILELEKLGYILK